MSLWSDPLCLASPGSCLHTALRPPPAPASPPSLFRPLPRGDVSAGLCPIACHVHYRDQWDQINATSWGLERPERHCSHLCPALGPAARRSMCWGLGNASTLPLLLGAGAASPSPLLAPKPEIAEPIIPRGYK